MVLFLGNPNCTQIFAILCIFPIIGIECARILYVAPIGCKSELNWHSSVVKELHSRGHQLTYVTSSPITANDSKNTLSQIVLAKVKPFELHQVFPIDSKDLLELSKLSKSPINFFFSASIDFILNRCHKTYEDAQFIKQVLNKSPGEFDLIIFPAFFHQCFYGLVHKFQVPFVLTSTLPPFSWLAAHSGSWSPPSFVPVPFVETRSKMDFKQRILNILMSWLHEIHEIYTTKRKCTEIYKKHLGNHYPTAFEIEKNVSLILANTHFATNYPHPSIYPSVIEIGGFNCHPAEELPKGIEEFLKKADDGFIYFSMGTLAKSSYIPKNVKQIFINVFSRLKQRVLWKVDKSDMDTNLPSNIMQSNWFPQNDVLGHSKIKCFITQGGLFSTQESIYNGVPVLGIPIIGDQTGNIDQLVDRGSALSLEILDLTENSLEKSLREILENSSYSIQAKKYSELFRDRPQSPVSLGMYWIDYIIKHKGAEHILSPARDLNFFQYFSLDVIALSLLFSFVMAVISFKLSRTIVQFLSKFWNSDKISSQKKFN